MMNIGEFARLGGVSTRMLRHYDAIGLLSPAHVDPHTSRRSYDVAQLAVLNRLIALKGLGFRLDEVGVLLAEGVESAEMQGKACCASAAPSSNDRSATTVTSWTG